MKLNLKIRLITIFVVGLIGLAPLHSWAEGISDKQADAILNELKQIRVLLQKQQALLQQRPGRAPRGDQNVSLPLGDTYAIGSKNAPVTLVEFTDYECPFCSRFPRTNPGVPVIPAWLASETSRLISASYFLLARQV